MEKVQTLNVIAKGGLILNVDEISQGELNPGSAIELVNFEPSPRGGYRRLSGYSKYDPVNVPGTGKILGIAVFNGGVVAARAQSGSTSRVYFSSNSGWTPVTSESTGVNTHFILPYRMFEKAVVVCDGSNRPVKWNGSTATILTNAPLGAVVAQDFKSHLFFGKDQTVTFSAPNNDENYSAIDGAGAFNVGDEVVRLKVFRDQLIIFCRNSIFKVTGDSAFNFALEPITKQMGCLAANSVQEIGGDLMFLSPDGIRPISATFRIGDYEIESVSRNIQNELTSALANYADNDISSVVIRAKTQYRIFFGRSSDAVVKGLGYLGALRNAGDGATWEWAKLQGILASCSADGLTGNQELVVHGAYDGFVYRQEYGASFDGRSVPYTYTLPHLNFGDSFFRKTMVSAKVFLEKEGINDITLQVRLNNNEPYTVQPEPQTLEDLTLGQYTFGSSASKFGSARFSSTSVFALKQNLIGSGQTVSVSFYGNNAGSPFTIKSMSFEFIPGGRR